jgi:hypothetical protein
MSELAIPQSARGETICTLFDGDFHFGFAALVNSLARGGYKGTVWAGYRGALPPWLSQLKRLNAPGHQYMAGDSIRVVFLLVETDIYLALYKPRFMLDLLTDQASDCKYIWFFDSDIFLRGSWSFFLHWQTCGVAVCQDVNYRTLPELDPLRHHWMDVARAMGLGKPRALNFYFNSGLAGVAREYIEFLELWQAVMEYAAATGVSMKQLTSGSRDMPFHIPDQDAMNVAAMFTEHPVSPTGPEVMGFLPGRSNLYHAVGPKPWRGSLLRRALGGEPPSNSAKFYFTQVSSPIRVYTPMQLRGKRLACAISAFIGRFYGRR